MSLFLSIFLFFFQVSSEKVFKILWLSPSPNGKKTFCVPCLLRKGRGDLVRKAGLVGEEPSKQAVAQIGATDRVRQC